MGVYCINTAIIFRIHLRTYLAVLNIFVEFVKFFLVEHFDHDFNSLY